MRHFFRYHSTKKRKPVGEQDAPPLDESTPPPVGEQDAPPAKKTAGKKPAATPPAPLPFDEPDTPPLYTGSPED